jgi:hypothetical protein
MYEVLLQMPLLIVASTTTMGSRLPPTNPTTSENCDQTNGDESPSADLAGRQYFCLMHI